MAACRLVQFCRSCSKCGPYLASLTSTNKSNILTKIQTGKHTRLFSASGPCLMQSTGSGSDDKEYIDDYEISYEEFKYVEQILPTPLVPQVIQHESYPTPSGWVPQNKALMSQHKFLVRRTKNHMLPVYTTTFRAWYGIAHQVKIKYIDGDIWALESELRNYLLKKTGLKDIKTQVHEVSRQIRVRGLHAPLVAEFLLQCGM